MLPNLTRLSLSGKKITNAVLNVLTTRCKGMTAQLNEFTLHNDHHEANAIDQLLATMPRLRSLSLPGSVCSDGLFGRHAAPVSHAPVCAHLSSWRAHSYAAAARGGGTPLLTRLDISYAYDSHVWRALPRRGALATPRMPMPASPII